MSATNTQANTGPGPGVPEPNQATAKSRISAGAMHIVGKITRKLVWVFSGLIFAGIFTWGLVEIGLNGPIVKLAFLGSTGKFTFDRFLLFAGIISLIPPSIMYLIDSRRRDSIDNNIPHLIRDIADAGRSGMTLTRAIEISAERDYGPLTKEIKKLMAKISFRVPLEKALQFFADRTGTMLSR